MRDDFSIKSDIIDVLEKITSPGSDKDIVASAAVEKVEVDNGVVRIAFTHSDALAQKERFDLEDSIYEAVEAVDGVSDVTIAPFTKSGAGAEQAATASPGGSPAGGISKNVAPSSLNPNSGGGGGGGTDDHSHGGAPTQGAPTPSTLEGVGQVIAVASGKGGVGKSTVAVNLALALAKLGHAVSILDIDIYGPSIPTLLGVKGRPAVRAKQIMPIEAHGMRLMSLGFILDDDTPVIWRGPIVTGIIRQFLQDVDWSGTDYLIVDMPPGTGDAQLALAQTVPVDGAVVVTTPSDLALLDAARGLQMFRTLDIDVLGIVENMSHYNWPGMKEAMELVGDLRDAGASAEKVDALEAVLKKNERLYIFGKDGGAKEAERLGIPLLGRIPLDGDVREGGDNGEPIVIKDENGAVAKAFYHVASEVVKAKPVGNDAAAPAKGAFSFMKS